MERYVPKKEWMAYAVGALGQGMVYAIMSSYISDFYMNVLKLAPVFVLLLMLLARVGMRSTTRSWLYCRPREPKAWKNAPLSTVYSNPDSHSDDPSVLCAQAVWNTVDGICGGHLCCLGHDLHRIRRAVLESAECDGRRILRSAARSSARAKRRMA